MKQKLKKSTRSMIKVTLLSILLCILSYFLLKDVVLSFLKEPFQASSYDISYLATNHYLKGGEGGTFKASDLEEIGYQGSPIKEGEVHISNDGDVAFALYQNKWCATKFPMQEDIIFTKEKSQKNCQLDNFSWTEEADHSGASDPLLTDDMIPIKWNGKAWVKASAENKKGPDYWYNYEKKEWANAVLVDSKVRDHYLEEVKEGGLIKEEDIVGYFVWIPRFRYQLFNPSFDPTSPQAISLEFETIYENKQGKEKGQYLSHPAFSKKGQSRGFWVSKYESGYRLDHGEKELVSKPNVDIWTNLSLSAMNQIAVSFSSKNKNIMTSSILTNMEWGAIAYLSQSAIGRCENKDCQFVKANQTRVTGQLKKGEPYDSKAGMLTSTTGNPTGVYDMNKHSLEAVMGMQVGPLIDPLTPPMFPTQQTGFDPILLNQDPLKSNFDQYSYGNTAKDQNAFQRSILGDALGETHGWFDSNDTFLSSKFSFLLRGAGEESSSIFSFTAYDGLASDQIGFRIGLKMTS